MLERSNINFTLDRFCRINKKFCAPIIKDKKVGQITKNFEWPVLERGAGSKAVRPGGFECPC